MTAIHTLKLHHQRVRTLLERLRVAAARAARREQVLPSPPEPGRPGRCGAQRGAAAGEPARTPGTRPAPARAEGRPVTVIDATEPFARLGHALENRERDERQRRGPRPGAR